MRRRDVERLYAEHARSLLGFLVYRTGNLELAEDVLSETFEAALRAGPLVKRWGSAEKAWLYTTALNRVRDQMRRRRTEERALERVGVDDPGASPPADVAADRDLVQRGLAELAPEEREALALRFGADMSVPEIARLVREPLTTVEGRVYRALRKLRALLAAEQ